jgi:hypothetical protein
VEGTKIIKRLWKLGEGRYQTVAKGGEYTEEHMIWAETLATFFHVKDKKDHLHKKKRIEEGNLDFIKQEEKRKQWRRDNKKALQSSESKKDQKFALNMAKEQLGPNASVEDVKVRKSEIMVKVVGANQNKVNASNRMWSNRFANEEAHAEWCYNHMKGIKTFHADDEKHAAWLQKLSEAIKQVWELRKSDPSAFESWHDALMTGVNAFHDDAEKRAVASQAL